MLLIEYLIVQLESSINLKYLILLQLTQKLFIIQYFNRNLNKILVQIKVVMYQPTNEIK